MQRGGCAATSQQRSGTTPYLQARASGDGRATAHWPDPWTIITQNGIHCPKMGTTGYGGCREVPINVLRAEARGAHSDLVIIKCSALVHPSHSSRPARVPPSRMETGTEATCTRGLGGGVGVVLIKRLLSCPILLMVLPYKIWVGEKANNSHSHGWGSNPRPGNGVGGRRSHQAISPSGFPGAPCTASCASTEAEARLRAGPHNYIHRCTHTGMRAQRAGEKLNPGVTPDSHVNCGLSCA